MRMQWMWPLPAIMVMSGYSAPGAAAENDSPSAQPKAESSIQEIVVTARRREESLQRVPIAVTAITGEDLDSKRIETAQDLQQFVPSLAVYSLSVRDGTTYSLRGQSSTLGAGQGVVAYMNDVPLPVNSATGSIGGGPGLYLDLDNLQVLNGPQGTLFGKNTTGGAILLQPKKPTNSLEGYVQAGFGNYNDREYEGVFNVPFFDDKLLLRVAAQRQTRDGFTRNVVDGQDLDNRDAWAVRVSVSFRPSDTFRNDLVFDETSSRSIGTGVLLTNVNPLGLVAALYSGAFGTPSILQALADQQARGIRATANTPPVNSYTDYWNVTDIAQWHIGEDWVLKNIGAFQVLKSALYSDTDGTAIPVISTFSTADVQDISEEIQLQGTSLAGNLVWTSGGFFEYEKPRGPEILNSVALAGTFIPPSLDNSINGSQQRSRAVYTQGTYNLGGLVAALDGVRLTAGYRYTWDFRRDFTSAVTPSLPPPNNCLAGQPPDCTFSATERSTAGTWTVGVDDQINRATLVYLKASRGYKPGGFNLSSLDPARTAFRPEYVKDVEFGLKKDWNFSTIQARTNIDAFHTDYTDIQKTVGIIYNNIPSSVTGNVAAATIDGIELAGSIVPAPDLELSGTYSYLDARYTKADEGFDARLPFFYTPRNKFSVSGRYRLPVPSTLGQLSLSATYAHTNKLFSATDFQPGDYIAAYGLVSWRIDWLGVMRSPIDLSFFMTNAADATYRVTNFPSYNSVGITTATYGEPRMFGLQLRYRWGAASPAT